MCQQVAFIKTLSRRVNTLCMRTEMRVSRKGESIMSVDSRRSDFRGRYDCIVRKSQAHEKSLLTQWMTNRKSKEREIEYDTTFHTLQTDIFRWSERRIGRRRSQKLLRDSLTRITEERRTSQLASITFEKVATYRVQRKISGRKCKGLSRR